MVETLNVAGMVRNRRLAKALTDAAVGGFLRELEWQCVKRGVRLLKAGMWFPSTQILRPVWWASQRTHRPVGAVVSLPPMRLAV